jgi:drug/metabolite transporter (DMT)-like permease
MAENGKREAGAFDIRVFIGSLLGIYGVVLLLTAWFGTSDADLAKAGGLNVNLWTGLGLVVAAAVFVGWARLRPVVVPAEKPSDDA